MNIHSICMHCGRLIRGDARAYAANGGLYHWECTEPAPTLHVARIELQPGDAVAVMLDKMVSNDQRASITQYVQKRLNVERVVVLDGGMSLATLAASEPPNVQAQGPSPAR